MDYYFASTAYSELVLSIHRKNANFTISEIEFLKRVCDKTGIIATGIHEQDKAKRNVENISRILEEKYGLRNVGDLSKGELSLLIEISKGRSFKQIAQNRNVRSDTISRQLKVAVAKLGLNENKELLSVLATT